LIHRSTPASGEPPTSSLCICIFLEVLDNKENANALKGAGIQAASMVSDKSADALLTGYCGPKAFMTLEAAKIRVANNVEGTVRDAVKSFNEGKLTFADKANVEGQW